MKGNNTVLMTKRAYAKYLGVNEKAIRNAINTGKIKNGWDAGKQQVNKNLADKEYGFLHLKEGLPAAAAVSQSGKDESKKSSPVKSAENAESAEASPQNKTHVRMSADGPYKLQKLPIDSDKDLSKLPAPDLLNLLNLTADMDYKAALTASTIIEAALKKKKLEELEDVLVRKSIVDATLFAFGSSLRKALLAIPSRVTDDMLSAATKVEASNVLLGELTRVLNQFANFDKVKLSNKN